MNINIEGSTNFGAVFEETLVDITGNNCEIRDTSFQLNNTTGGKSVAVRFTGSDNRTWNCRFRRGTSVAYRVGIQYDAGSGNVDTDSIFTT